ncbi:MAG TPA: phospholipase D-like domain-containing protein [Xanthobacteraceae bacterium]|nr:phospholipase D-like domain-containing protein [Xanthobacteraceae bacterium]
MAIDLKVYDNGDHTCLVWLPSDAKAIANCRGFTIHRLLKADASKPAVESYLPSHVGFVDGQKLDPTAPWKMPLQRYLWWDYLVDPGNVVQYSIVPVCGPDKDHLSLNTADASALTPPMTITGQTSAHISAYFNKGIVSAQWVARDLAALGKKAKLADLIAKPGTPLRNSLSGLLRQQLLDLLDDVKKNNGEIYAALYELNDPELIPKLLALGQKCHLILANGAFKPPTNDENKAVRAQLHGKVDLHDRLVSSGHFAHNKFVVACDSAGKPQRVLSGSTNWTVTGLCTQANNGILVDDPGLGQHFIDEWNLLKAAGNGYPASLMQANATSKSFPVDGATITQWFAPTDKGEDLDFARQLINGAEQGILFLFFNPGAFEPDDKPEMWTLLQNVLVRHQAGTPNYNPNLYIHGVVNQEIAGLTTENPATPNKKHAALDPATPSPVKLFDGGNTAPQAVPFESMVPKAIKEAFHDWIAEVMNQGVHVHSKVIVIDPFGKKPVVITGSHNLGHKASTANDDNMMIVQGNAPLAAAYAANIIAIFQNYRWNTYVDAHAKDPQVWHGLVDNATWQDSYLDPTRPDLAEIKFWLGEGASSPGAAGQPAAAPAAGGTQVRAATATGPSPHRGKSKGQSSAAKKPPKKHPTKKSPAKKHSAKKATKKPAAKKKKPARKAKPAKKRKHR